MVKNRRWPFNPFDIRALRPLDLTPIVRGPTDVVLPSAAARRFRVWHRAYYLGVSFSNLLVGGVTGVTVPVPLSVST
jgi:hypothetical protein